MSAQELFDICLSILDEGPTDASCRRMHETLVLCCAEATRQSGQGFGNLFSQIDFLCREHGIGQADRQDIQAARRHSNESTVPSAEQLRYDLRALVRFVSAVMHEDVPGTLLSRLPANRPDNAKLPPVNARCIRCIVRRWDDSTIFADSDHGELIVDYSQTEGGVDLGYLRKLLREGMQLNLLDCHVEHLNVSPRLVVVEPDFLVDISSIAACFTDYGHSPLLYTANRLKPRANTQPILLGIFAGQALDDLIHDPDFSVERSISNTFRQQVLQFCACEGFNSQQFASDAERQCENLREVVDVLFPTPQLKEKALLEPSFVCERLGLQGRVDLMTTDMHLLVEQKAGKNMNIERHSSQRQREDHYVQLLLYYGILRYNFGISDQRADIRLLYSRYPAAEGLLVVNFYQQLFREAIRFRNQVVATEYLIAREGFGRLVPHLNLAAIYRNVQRDAFFDRYIAPQLNSVLAPIRPEPSVLHRYYERMMTFVYREQLLSKVGAQEGQGSAAAYLWQMPLTEKLETGNIYIGLRLEEREKSSDYTGYDTLIFTLNSTPTTPLSVEPGGAPNFRRGDMVYVYSYDGEPDVRRAILFKGTLQAIETERLVVRLNDGQQNPLLFDASKTWAIEHGTSDITTNSAIRSLHQLLSAEPRRQQVLLGQRVPEADTSLQLSRSYHPHYDDVLLRIRQARDFFLLVGPPGTGKTSMALRFMVEEALVQTQKKGGALLLTAYTNRAVDEICDMLTAAAFPYLRIGNEASCDPRFRDHLLDEIDNPTTLIRQTPIIVSTTATLQARPFIFSLKHFALCIVDEASQILEPNIIGLLSSSQIDRFVLIGDYKQLPAVVQQGEEEAAVSDPVLRNIGLTDCRQSLFERLIHQEQQAGRTQFIGLLRHQGRMHPDIAAFPNRMFYAREQLDCVPLPHQQETELNYQLPSRDALDDLLKERRVLFFNRRKEDDGQSDKTNATEAQLVADLLLRIRRFYGERFSSEKTVGVIVPYRNQIAMIRQALAQTDCPELQQVSIDTVERYQGSQRDVIVYSFTVSRAYQLDFLTQNTFEEDGHQIDRKLNVAMTRARCQLLMVGDALLLSRNPLFAQLIREYSV